MEIGEEINKRVKKRKRRNCSSYPSFKGIGSHSLLHNFELVREYFMYE